MQGCFAIGVNIVHISSSAYQTGSHGVLLVLNLMNQNSGSVVIFQVQIERSEAQVVDDFLFLN